MKTVSVFDVAIYILQKQGIMSAMKLQKLVYYSQAWSLVWDDEPIFKEKIEAWANGPVVRELYDKHKGLFEVDTTVFQSFQTGELDQRQKETVDAVLKFYGNKSAQWLSDQTHSEAPWQNARKGLADNERGDKQMTLAEISEYYGSI